MKGIVKKINVILVFLVMIGTIFANINIIASIVPNNNHVYVSGKENQVINDTFALDYETVAEVFDYFMMQAKYNDFEQISTIISSGLIFESEKSLIVIGHGHFDSKNQYRIADYTANIIRSKAEQKQTVALLGCYSSFIKLDNEIQLTYSYKVNLESALHDLIILLDWSVSCEFNPSTNIQLIDLDPGGCNGWSISNPPPLYNIRKEAYCPAFSITWNLNSETAIQALSTFMYNHYMTAFRLYYEGDFLKETSPGSNSYYIIREKVQFNLWISIPGGVWEYLNFANIRVNNVPKSSYTGSIKLFDIESEMMNVFGMTYQESKYALAGIFGTIGMGMLALGCSVIAWAIDATVKWLAILAYIGGALAVLLGIVLVIIALVATISAYYSRTE